MVSLALIGCIWANVVYFGLRLGLKWATLRRKRKRKKSLVLLFALSQRRFLMSPSFFELVCSLKSCYSKGRIEVELTSEDGEVCTGKVISLKMADGSGQNWLVKLNVLPEEFFIRAN